MKDRSNTSELSVFGIGSEKHSSKLSKSKFKSSKQPVETTSAQSSFLKEIEQNSQHLITNKWKIGQLVEAFDKKGLAGWFPGKVVDVQDRQVRVHFHGFR